MERFFRAVVNIVGIGGTMTALFVVGISYSGSLNTPVLGQGATAALSHAETEFSAPPKVSQENDRRDEATMIFVGDIMLSRAIGTIAQNLDDPQYPFQYVKDYLKTGDIVFGNLEGPISGRGKNQGSIYSFNAEPNTVLGLMDGGFNIVSVANNHIFDYGRQAFLDTLAVLAISRIDPVGGGIDYTTAHTPVIKTIADTRIAFLAYTNLIPRSYTNVGVSPAVAYLEEMVMKRDIENAKTLADMVVVSFHWGEEYETAHNDWQERIGKTAIDAGATLVVGHHPHVVQEIEQYNGGYIAYSLGNFIFDQNFSPDTGRGLILEVTVAGKKITNIRTLGVSFNETFQPVFIEQ